MSTETHRVALEPRSGIWLLFYETLHEVKFYAKQGLYKQQLLQIFKDFDAAATRVQGEKIVRNIFTETIVRDDSHRDESLRA